MRKNPQSTYNSYFHINPPNSLSTLPNPKRINKDLYHVNLSQKSLNLIPSNTSRHINSANSSGRSQCVNVLRNPESTNEVGHLKLPHHPLYSLVMNATTLNWQTDERPARARVCKSKLKLKRDK